MSDRTRELKVDQLRDIAARLRQIRSDDMAVKRELDDGGEQRLQTLLYAIDTLDRAIILHNEAANILEARGALVA